MSPFSLLSTIFSYVWEIDKHRLRRYIAKSQLVSYHYVFSWMCTHVIHINSFLLLLNNLFTIEELRSSHYFLFFSSLFHRNVWTSGNHWFTIFAVCIDGRRTTSSIPATTENTLLRSKKGKSGWIQILLPFVLCRALCWTQILFVTSNRWPISSTQVWHSICTQKSSILFFTPCDKYPLKRCGVPCHYHSS